MDRILVRWGMIFWKVFSKASLGDWRWVKVRIRVEK